MIKCSGAGIVVYYDNRDSSIKGLENDILYLSLIDNEGLYDFPKGGIDEGEYSFQCALRETYEEINLKNSDLKILGELPFFYTGTGYKVKPIISKLNNNVFLEETLKPDLNEIEKIFIADAEELLSPINHFRIKAPQNSLMKMTWKVKYKNENIWGLTARLLVTLSAGFNLREYPPCNNI